MGRAPLQFDDLRKRATERIGKFLESRTLQCATMGEIRKMCRVFGMGEALAESIVGWLEQDGVVKWVREVEAVYWIPPAKRGRGAGDEAAG